MKKEKGKILIEGMDLSGKSTVVNVLNSLIDDSVINRRTISEQSQIYDFTVAQSKKGDLHQDLIHKLYILAISEDLYNYKLKDNCIVLQDSYFALRSYALAKEKYPNTLAKEVFNLLKLFPTPELSFYLTASTEERVRRNEKRDKPMAYMENLLITNPKEFEKIEENLREITTSLFQSEIIDTQDKSPDEIAHYIMDKIQEKNKDRGDEVYERE